VRLEGLGKLKKSTSSGIRTGDLPACSIVHRWMNNIKKDLREVRWEDMDWIDLAQGSVGGSCEHGNEPSGSMKCWEILEGLHKWRPLKKGSVHEVSLVGLHQDA
jgi:hypothetical protein